MSKDNFWEGYVPEPVGAVGSSIKSESPLGCNGPTGPAQQEPVAFLDWYDNAHWGNEDFKAGCWRAWDAALAQRKPLTDEEIIASNYPDGEENGPTIAAPDFELICFARQIEAAHGIKENT